jgi:hypothetical protein
MDWLFGIFGACTSRGSKPPPPAADIEKDSSAYKGPCAHDDDVADDLMAPGRLYNLCKAKEAPPIDLVQQLLSDPTTKSERISYKSPKDNECVRRHYPVALRLTHLQLQADSASCRKWKRA